MAEATPIVGLSTLCRENEWLSQQLEKDLDGFLVC